jgi:hypothetical protein
MRVRERAMSIQCDSCRETVPGFDTIHYGSMEAGYRDLCGRCFNQEVAKLGGLNFEHVAFEPVDMRDAVDGAHRFHFRVHHLGDQVSLEAFELKDGAPGGYQFQILGEAEADLFGLMGQLIERMRRTLTQQHLEKDDQFGLVIKDSLVRGRIDWDSDEEGRVPLLVIDGQEVSWEKFGRMVMGFEGWQFKFEIRDRSEEV